MEAGAEYQAFFATYFAPYAYTPFLVYGAIWLSMTLSAFGMPISEEVVLISAGFVGYMALHPELFPPPSPDAQRINVYVLATVCFVAVVVCDYLIFFLGRRFGPRLFKMRWFSRIVSPAALEKTQTWMRKYGYFAVMIFRFTPGVRFPGHLMCGAMGLKRWKFIAFDAFAAGFSVPTQVLLVAFYGEHILKYFREFKLVFFGLLAAGCLSFLAYKYYQQRRTSS